MGKSNNFKLTFFYLAFVWGSLHPCSCLEDVFVIYKGGVKIACPFKVTGNPHIKTQIPKF